MRRCFQCGALTDVAALTRVGDGEFCATCFRALLAAGGDAPEARAGAGSANARASSAASAGPSEPERAAAARPREPVAPRAKPPAAERRTCLVCDCDLTGAPAVVFLGGEICGPCSAEMAAELEAAHAGPSTEPSIGAEAARAEPATAAAAPTTAAAEPAPGPSEADDSLAFTPGTGVVICAGCERPMPGPGSYRVLRGKPYCAACIPFFARLPPAAYELPAEASSPAASGAAPGHPVSSANRPVSSVPASSSPLARPGQCDCCRRALDENAAQREGFALCSACLTSDAELALSVARARHRRALGRLRSKLEGSS